MIESSASERGNWTSALARWNEGMPPEVAGPQALPRSALLRLHVRQSNTVTPRQVRIWHDGTSDPTPPWMRESPQS
jgi:hypothetical protein